MRREGASFFSSMACISAHPGVFESCAQLRKRHKCASLAHSRNPWIICARLIGPSVNSRTPGESITCPPGLDDKDVKDKHHAKPRFFARQASYENNPIIEPPPSELSTLGL